jgi:hypothetical protein
MMATEPNSLTEVTNATRRSLAEIEEALTHIRDALRGLEYGEVSIIVQDGVVIQIERTERRRLRRRASK